MLIKLQGQIDELIKASKGNSEKALQDLYKLINTKKVTNKGELLKGKLTSLWNKAVKKDEAVAD